MTLSKVKSPIRKTFFPIYPILFTIYPVIFLFTVNRREVILWQLVLPLLSSIALLAISWSLIHFWMRNRLKSALSVTILITLFFLYGRIYDVLEPFSHLSATSFFGHAMLVPIMLGLWIVLTGWIFLTKRNLIPLSRIFNVIGVFLVGTNLLIHGLFLMDKSFHPQPGPSGEEVSPVLNSSKELPDIYYIVLDGFASEKSLKELYNHPQSDFYKFLKDKGFYICPHSQTSDILTLPSMAARFNYRTIQKGEDPVGLIRQAPAVSYLKGRGYAIHTFPIFFNIHFDQADFVHHFILDKGKTLINDFHLMCLKTTMFRFFYDRFIKSNRYSILSRNIVLHVYRKIQNVIKEAGPKFVHVHVYAPHAPFVFDADGKPVSYDNFYNFKEKQYYLNQSLYIAKRTKKMIETIINHSKTPPVIILQSDHGPRGDDIRLPERAHRNPDEIRVLDVGEHWKYILNAFYFPRKNFEDLDLNDSFDPINTFPLLFKIYFDYAISFVNESP